MTAARTFVALAMTCALVPAFPQPVAANAPVPLDYKAYDGWNAIRTPKLSDDGKYLAYALTPQDGDPTLVVRDLDSGVDRREARGNAPAFAAGGRFVVFTHVAPKKDVDAAKKAKKPEAQLPKNGVGILDLRAPGGARFVESIKSFAVAKDGGPVIAYRAEPSPSPSPSASPAATASPSPGPNERRPARTPPRTEPLPSVTPAPGASGSPVPSASPSASPAPKADKTKEPGALLTIDDLAADARITADNATEFVISDDDRFIAYATETKSGKGDGLHVYDVAKHATVDVLTGEGRYRNLTIARNGSALAFLSDAATFAGDVPHDAAYVVDLRAANLAALKAVDLGSAGLPPNTTPNANGTLAFSHDGQRLFLGTAAAPTPMPSGTPEPTKVDLWSWRDDVLQSQQKHDADRERKRTYLAVYDLPRSHFVQLGSPALRDVRRNQNPDVALGEDDRAYRRAASWLGEDDRDLYAVSLTGGGRRLLTRRAGDGELSPGGRYVLFWDWHARHWVALGTGDGRRTTLAAHAGVAFEDVDDDHPGRPQPYGFGGWLSGDRGVLLYDQYDVWLANPSTGAARDLTHGEGRRTQTVYSPLQTGPRRRRLRAGQTGPAGADRQRTYASGYARIAASGGVPATLFKVDEIVNGSRPVFDAGCTIWPCRRSPQSTPTGSRSAVSRSARIATCGRRTVRSAGRSKSPTRTRSSRSTAGAPSG